MRSKNGHIQAAQEIIIFLGLPKAQQNERSALCLLALLNLTPDKTWVEAESPCMGITPIMDWVRKYYGKDYAPNTRETFRRETMHQFRDAGIALYNPDDPDRAVNSPKAVYQVAPAALNLLRLYETSAWDDALVSYLDKHPTLISRYEKKRKQNLVPVKISENQEVIFSPGNHSKLIRDVIEEFAPRFAPGSVLVYAGDTGNKWAYCDTALMGELGIDVDLHGKMPDVMLHYAEKNWLFLVEAVTSHGPVNGKRYEELAELCSGVKADLVYVTAFPDRSSMRKFLPEIAWETEAWVADSPSHLMHFNGTRFLGPHNG